MIGAAFPFSASWPRLWVLKSPRLLRIVGLLVELYGLVRIHTGFTSLLIKSYLCLLRRYRFLT